MTVSLDAANTCSCYNKTLRCPVRLTHWFEARSRVVVANIASAVKENGAAAALQSYDIFVRNHQTTAHMHARQNHVYLGNR